jgi:small subunit ribosomal protein S14
MSKVSAVEKNNRRARMAKRDLAKRQALKTLIMKRTLPVEERFQASLKLAKLPETGRVSVCGFAVR